MEPSQPVGCGLKKARRAIRLRMTAVVAPIWMIEDQLAALVARNGNFAVDSGAPILSAATRRKGVPSLMPGLAAV